MQQLQRVVVKVCGWLDERDELAPPHIPLLGKESAKIDHAAGS